MTRHHHWLIALGAFVLTTFGFSLTALSDAKGKAYLAKVDKAQSQYKTLTVRYKLTTKEPKRKARIIKLWSRFKGHKQLTELLAPADVKGTKALHLSSTRVYVYLPQYRKVRRIASHALDQEFMGTAYNQADINLLRYSGMYNAKFVTEDASSYTLKLTKKSKSKSPYSKIELVASKKNNMPLRLKYWDKGGRQVKSDLRRDYVCVKGVCMARFQKLTDHTKGGKYSTLELTGYEINPKFKKRLFSKRSLRP